MFALARKHYFRLLSIVDAQNLPKLACRRHSPSPPLRRNCQSSYSDLRDRIMTGTDNSKALDASHPLVWIDCEMTGLNVDTDVIIEIFCLITNGNLDLIDEKGWGTVIHQSKETMDKMDQWCTKTHGESGLTAAVLSSTTTPSQAADSLLEYIKKYIPEKGRALLAGNSVHADKAFLRKQPYAKVIEHLSYRILDVSTIKEAAKRWSDLDVLIGVPEKKGLHQAREDILESIEEARYYKEAIFQKKTCVSDGKGT